MPQIELCMLIQGRCDELGSILYDAHKRNAILFTVASIVRHTFLIKSHINLHININFTEVHNILIW